MFFKIGCKVTIFLSNNKKHSPKKAQSTPRLTNYKVNNAYELTVKSVFFVSLRNL